MLRCGPASAARSGGVGRMGAGAIRAWRGGDGSAWRAGLVEEEGRRAYDAFVRASPRGHPLQLWSWGEVKRADGWTPLRLAVEHDGGIAAAIGILEKPLSRATRLRFWFAPRGPVAHPAGPAAARLWEAVGTLALSRGAVVLRCDPEWPPQEGRLLCAAGLLPLPPHAGWYLGALQPLRVWRISLQGGLDAVFSRFEPHTRQDVRRALKKGLRLREGTLADLPAFHALERAAAERKLWRAWNEGGDGRLLLAEYEGRVVGGAWFLACGRGCWGQFAAADLAYRRLLPTVALYWAGLNWAVERRCAFCDFGGIGHRPDAADGLWAFKKGFGPGDTRFCGEHDLVFQPVAYRAFRLAEEARWAWYGRRGHGRS